MKILAIVGSPRLKGNINNLIDRTLEAAAELGAQVKKIDLSKYKVNPCIGHADCSSFTSCTQEDDASWILDEFLYADGVILATPVYWYNASWRIVLYMMRGHKTRLLDRMDYDEGTGIRWPD